MFTNRVLRVTFLISLLTHGVIFLHIPSLTPFPPLTKEQKMQVQYIKESLQISPLSKDKPKPDAQKSIDRQDPFLRLDAKVIANRKIPPPYIEQ